MNCTLSSYNIIMIVVAAGKCTSKLPAALLLFCKKVLSGCLHDGSHYLKSCCSHFYRITVFCALLCPGQSIRRLLKFSVLIMSMRRGELSWVEVAALMWLLLLCWPLADKLNNEFCFTLDYHTNLPTIKSYTHNYGDNKKHHYSQCLHSIKFCRKHLSMGFVF